MGVALGSSVGGVVEVAVDVAGEPVDVFVGVALGPLVRLGVKVAVAPGAKVAVDVGVPEVGVVLAVGAGAVAVSQRLNTSVAVGPASPAWTYPKAIS